MARNFIEANKGTPVGSPGRYQVREPVQHPLHLAAVSWNTYKLTELILRGSTQAWHCTTWAGWEKAWTTRMRLTWQGCAISPTRSSSCQAPLATRYRRDSFVSFKDLWLSGLADSSWMGKTRAVPSFTLHLQCSDSWGEEGPVEKSARTWCWTVPE